MIRGLDVVSDAQALKTVAAQQLDVDTLAFDEVVGVLEAAGFVDGIRRDGSKITTFTESVPYYDDLYISLGRSWSERRPTELEEQLLTIVDGLARSPVALDQLETTFRLDGAALPDLLQVGRDSGLVQVLRLVDGDIAYTPFYVFEDPQAFSELVEQHGSDRLAAELRAVRARQGLPVDSGSYPLLVVTPVSSSGVTRRR